MNKTEAKNLIKEWGLYHALYELKDTDSEEGADLLEIIERVIDNIPAETLAAAIRKGAK